MSKPQQQLLVMKFGGIKKIAQCFSMTCLSVLCSAHAYAARPSVPFNAALYGLFVMNSSEPTRNYQTTEQVSGLKKIGLRHFAFAPKGFAYIGTWYTKRALYEEQGQSPAITTLYSIDKPGPPTNSTVTAAYIEMIVQSANGRKVMGHMSNPAYAKDYKKNIVNGNTIYSFCPTMTPDYPQLAEQIKTSCIARGYKNGYFFQVTGINVKEAEVVDRVATVLRASLK